MSGTIRFLLGQRLISAGDFDPQLTVLDWLRAQRRTGTKEGCGQGECGACTVLVDGVSVDSCIYPAFEIEGKTVTTIEGLVGEGNRLFQDAYGPGLCKPGYR